MATVSRDKKMARRLKIGLGFLVAAVVLGGMYYGGAFATDEAGGTTVPPPTATERADTVTLLSRASQTQGVCYGWRLTNNRTPISVGSNLGENIEVGDDEARCPRWVKIVGDVDYAAATSEANDYASFTVETSQDLAAGHLEEGLRRLGLNPDQFIDDPGWAICRGAVFLPLLVAEAGAAKAAPAPTGGPGPGQATPGASAPAALPDAGSDFLRARWAYLLGAGGLLVLTVLFLAIGRFERRHERRPQATERAGRAPGNRAPGTPPTSGPPVTNTPVTNTPVTNPPSVYGTPQEPGR